MKLWIFILVLAISAQPLQAGICDMHPDEGPVSSQHEGHPGMDHSDHGKHDCCDPAEPMGTDTPSGCGGDMNCGPCFVSVTMLLPELTRIAMVPIHRHAPGLSSGVVLPSHSSPPFRPPIS